MSTFVAPASGSMLAQVTCGVISQMTDDAASKTGPGAGLQREALLPILAPGSTSALLAQSRQARPASRPAFQRFDAGEPVMVAVTSQHAKWLCHELGPSACKVRSVDMSEVGRGLRLPASQAISRSLFWLRPSGARDRGAGRGAAAAGGDRSLPHSRQGDRSNDSRCGHQAPPLRLDGIEALAALPVRPAAKARTEGLPEVRRSTSTSRSPALAAGSSSGALGP